VAALPAGPGPATSRGPGPQAADPGPPGPARIRPAAGRALAAIERQYIMHSKSESAQSRCREKEGDGGRRREMEGDGGSREGG
jgi:hypothetical protein